MDHSPQDEIALYGIQANVTTVATTPCYRQHLGSTHTWWTVHWCNQLWYCREHSPKEIMVGNVCAPWCNEATQLYSCLQVPAEREQPHSASRSTPELVVTCFPSMCFDASTQTRSAQLACSLAWITSAQGSLPMMDPIYPYMVCSVAPPLGSQNTLVLDPTGWTCTGRLQTPPTLPY